MSSRAARTPYLTQTLAKGLEVLEALSARREASLTEFAGQLGISTPTLFRMLATLVTLGYAEKLADGRYRSTLKTWAMGAQVLQRLNLREAARPHLEGLCAATHEAPHLAVREGSDVVIIDRLEAPHPVRVETYLGQKAPVFCSAIGKAILAHERTAVQAQLLAAPLPRFTLETVNDPAALRRELAQVRARGYAINQEEWRRGVCAVAMPILGAAGAPVAALSLTMPTERFQKGALERRFLPALKRAAALITQALGGPALESGMRASREQPPPAFPRRS